MLNKEKTITISLDEYYRLLGSQKQVDELTDKLGKVLSGIKADELLVAKGIEQAVKDMAKEILQGFMKWLNQAISNSYEKSINGSVRDGGMNTAFHEVKDLVKKVAESKGVEVE